MTPETHMVCRAPRPVIGRIAAGLTLVFAWHLPVVVHADDEDARLKRLVDKIARGDEVESAAAGEQLIELITDPVADAIGSLNDRPVEEQVRLRRVLTRLTGALRMRLVRVDLPPEDRELFDKFAAAYPQLVQNLFDGNYRVRKAAVLQIPLDPDTGAGVLIAAKVDDEDEDVATAALEVAARLHDAVVARNLTRYIRDATATVASGFYGPQEQDLAGAVAGIVLKSIAVVAAAEATDSAPALIDAVRFFGSSRYWNSQQCAEALGSLGQLGDRRAADLLLEFLDAPAQLRSRATETGRHISETLGDVALLSLLQLYRLEPQEYGMTVLSAEDGFAGYLNEEARRAGHRAFRIWHGKHAGASRAETDEPTSQRSDE